MRLDICNKHTSTRLEKRNKQTKQNTEADKKKKKKEEKNACEPITRLRESVRVTAFEVV